MRPDVRTFVTDGPLPDQEADEEEIERRERQLQSVPRPVTAEEAAALARCFGPDDCYGLAWTLVHLVETAPAPPPVVPRPGPGAPDWAHTLWRRWGEAEAAV
ncbi:hypothetical protein [Streptomyces sp. CC208A]|uniref:hypothetical protein n=1 Tax=Streptomyces sp. CC208A TaxID=3044573 RepID=UPI0024A7AB41|nr:hypothetical protein [Streptomyces sp. CC208A]